MGVRSRRPGVRRHGAARDLVSLHARPHGRAPDGPFAGFRGFLQADAYAGYDGLYRGGVTEVACWAHFRRKVFDLHERSPTPLTTDILERIGAIYAVEAEVRGQPPDIRCCVRQERSKPLVQALREVLDAALRHLSPRSDMAKAIAYGTKRWQALSRFLGEGRLEIDNNIAERALRGVAIGRRNWLFAGSRAGGERAAAIYTVIQTCKANGVDPQAYIADVIAKVAGDWPASRRSYHGVKLHRTVRPRRTLSGLGVCGLCGEGWIVIGTERWGCTKHKSDGSCTNNRQITTEHYERRVLAALRQRMLDPALVEVFVREYHAEYARRAADSRRDEARLRKRLTAAQGKVKRLVAAIAAGGQEFADIREALAEARAEQDAAERALAELEAMPVVALNPTVAADYRAQVERLNEALADPEARLEAIPALRELIDRIVLTPNPDGRGVLLEVEGRLAAIIDLASGKSALEERLFVMERVKGFRSNILRRRKPRKSTVLGSSEQPCATGWCTVQ